MKKPKGQVEFERLSVFQSIWLQARCNGAVHPPDPPVQKVKLPTNTWLQRRLDKIRKGEPVSLEDRLKASLQIVRANKQ